MLAIVAEIVDYWGATNALMHGAKPHKMPKPLRIPRPGETRTRKVETDPNAIKAFFGRIFGGR